MEKIYMGLDIGTNSVGWAVVNENYQLVKKNGFTMWGVRMFEESSDAKTRRQFRTSRRGLNRRKYRLNLLRDIFNNEINKIDPTFFERLEDSFYHLEDKRNQDVYNLFNGEYTDKDFYNEYPTIYHLRKHLLNSNQKEDIRFIYLAIHNMVKYRGNFLNTGEIFDINDSTKIKVILLSFNEVLKDFRNEYEDDEDYFELLDVTDELLEKFESIMLSNESKRDKKNNLIQLFNVGSKTLVAEAMIPLIVGSKVNISSLKVVKDEKYEKCEISLDEEDLEAVINEKRTIVPEMQSLFDFVLEFKVIQDNYYLKKLLGSGKSLSDAMVKRYEDHQNDLKQLKRLIKKYAPKKYNNIFKVVQDKYHNYPSYIGYNVTTNHKNRFAHSSREDFYKYIKSELNDIKDESAQALIAEINAKIDRGEYMLRQNSNQNGSIPMQLNLNEIKTILSNQKDYYPFISEKDENGFSNYDKIISIFKFKIPYYVGPLNSSSTYSWVVRSNEKIYPWNYKDVINLDESAINFIQRMQRKCTYLKGDEDYCLPKNSLLFSEYNCLSYLNKISINGALISQKLKDELFNNVFLKIKKPTKKNIYEYLKANYGMDNAKTSTLKELPEVNCDMSSYIYFKEIFMDKFDENKEMIERIIKDILIFEDKSILEKRLLNVYKLPNDIIKKIKGLNFKKYSGLSRHLLSGLKISNQDTGEYYGTVIEIMRNTNYNLQEILYDERYRLIDIIDSYNKGLLCAKGTESVEDFINDNIVISPIMKRPLVQTYTLIEEVEKILGRKIDKYFVECTRTNKAKKEEKASRYNQVKELYKSCEKMSFSSLNINLNMLNAQLDRSKDKLRSDLIYLYFTQLGRSMYSLRPIDFSKLFNNDYYDIDHIYPQSLIKDDSISNRVLVEKNENAKKLDSFLFEVPNLKAPNANQFYELLFEKKLISKEKYKRLIEKEVNQGKIDNFVNRQLVVTNQAVKGLINLLKLYKNVDQNNIIFSKGENITAFRHYYDMPKSRLANNYHHAHDAYLNAVVGNVLNEYYKGLRYKTSSDYYRLKSENKSVNPEKILNRNQYVNGKEIWNKNSHLALIKKNLYERYDIHETLRTYNSNLLFKKVSIDPSGSDSVIPTKSSGPKSNAFKYGGIKSNSYYKYVIIKTINKKGIEEYILEAIPKSYEKNNYDYLSKIYDNYIIMCENVKANCILLFDSKKVYVTGKTGDSFVIKNAYDRHFDINTIKIIKKVEKYIQNTNSKIEMLGDEDNIVISPAKDNKCDEILITKDEVLNLIEKIKYMYLKEIYSFTSINEISKKLTQNIVNLTIRELILLSNELLGLLKTNERKSANLLLVGMSKSSGILFISKKLKSGMKFISESITGYYHKVLFEVPNQCHLEQ